MKVTKLNNKIEVDGTVTNKRYTYDYVLPTLEVINKRITSFIEKHPGVAKINKIGQTRLGYPIEEITIGNGPKDLFIVGGTHSNEIIAVDTITQFLEHFDEDFDESLLSDVSIHIIPIQNPEGYKVIDSLLTEVNGYVERNGMDLEEFCQDYYINYRTDSLIYIAFREMNKFMTDENFISHYRNYIMTNEAYKRLHQDNALKTLNRKLPYIGEDGDPEMLTFDEAILQIDPELPLEEYLKQVRYVITDTMKKLDRNNKHDEALRIYLEMLHSSLVRPLTLVNLNAISKLHQEQLKQMSLNAAIKIKNEVNEIKEQTEDYKLKADIEKSLLMTCTREQLHTIIGEFAATIVDGVNLNGNTPYSPGIEVARTGEEKYSLNGSISNLRNYSKESPLGASLADLSALSIALDETNMPYAIENLILMDALNRSVTGGTYGGCILCHGTGGELYYKPNEDLAQNKYLNISEYNEEIVDAMQEAIDSSVADLDPERFKELQEKGSHYYRKKESDDKTGFGDLLRAKYPGVIMYENSVMGGNQFGPYGDVANYARTLNCFSRAISAACKKLSLSRKPSI